MKKRDENEMCSLCDRVREVAYAIARYHGNGYLEKIYERALIHRLQNAGMKVESQKSFQISDEDGTLLGEGILDLVVEDSRVLELKACKELTREHQSQLLHYPNASNIQHGMLVNFGSFKFQIRKFIQKQSSHLQNGSL